MSFAGRFLLLRRVIHGNTYAQYNVGGNWVTRSFAAKLGEFHDKLGTNPSAGQYGKVLNKQREFIRAWGFPAPSSAKANGTHAAISGATITYHRLQYNEFRDFDTQHLNAARAGLFGYPAIHPKVFPRENRVSCASSPLFLHTLNPSSFLGFVLPAARRWQTTGAKMRRCAGSPGYIVDKRGC
jgi:hypothetical protein